MMERLQLRQMSVAEVDIRNTLFQGEMHIAFSWLGRDWKCRLGHARGIKQGEVRLDVSWGGAKAVLYTSMPLLEMTTQAFLQTSDVSALPTQLRLALLETAFSELAEQLEAASKRHLRIDDLIIVQHRAGAVMGWQETEGIAWVVECGGQEFEGELVLDANCMAIAAATRSGQNSNLCIRQSLTALPITVQFVVGTTTLPLAAFSSLQVRDVILLDESWLQQQEMLTVTVADNAAFRARLSGARLVVTEGLASIMDDNNDDSVFATHDIVSELPIKLTFDLGERTLSLGELQILAPGYVFDLGRDLRQAVTIRANGMRVGEGELVDIEGRTGVAVLSITGRLE